MSYDRLLSHQKFLWQLARTRSENARRQLLASATTDEILMVVEICVNILKFRFPLNVKQKRKLARHATYLRQLARVRTEQSARKILQKGDGAMFASLLLPVLAEVASRVVSSLKS